MTIVLFSPFESDFGYYFFNGTEFDSEITEHGVLVYQLISGKG